MYRTALFIIVSMFVSAWLSGCASAKVEGEKPISMNLPRPDMIVVENFAVAPSEVKLDSGVMATVYRDSKNRTLTQEEMQVGHMVSTKLSEKLVAQLNKDGIRAVQGGSAVPTSPTTVVLKGQFVDVDQGNQSERVWIGFGLGGSELKSKALFFQNNKLIEQADTSTKASLKPGMAASGAAAVATGGAAPVVIGAAGAGFSEEFLAGVDADATRTADQLAKKIKDYYKERGWLN